MKIKILVVVITVIILTALSVAGFYVYKQIAKPVPSTIDENQQAAGENKEFVTEPETEKEVRLVKDDFEITLPAGWQEATSTYEDFLVLAFDGKEDISGGNFQKLDFRTNISIKSDDLTKYSNLDTLEKYIESMKISLIQVFPGIKFIKEEGNILECETTQEDVDFKTLLVFIEGNNSIIYAISFNTFRSSWEKYKDTFEQVASSFKLKYKIEL